MAIVLTNGAVFLHVPKTGGSFVSQVLHDQQLVDYTVGHIHADRGRAEAALRSRRLSRSAADLVRDRLPVPLKQRLKRAVPGVVSTAKEYDASQPFVFCFVRNPHLWYESFWRYMVGRVGNDWSTAPDYWRWHPCRPLIAHGGDDFPQFMERVIEHEPGFVTQLYARFICDQPDFVGRQENLVDDLAAVLTRLGLDFDEASLAATPRVNVSSDVERSIDWPDDIKVEVARLEHAARVRFGYVDG